MEVTDMYKQEQCISNLEQQISWIEDIKAHQFPGWGHTVNAMRQAIALLTAQEPMEPTLDIRHGKSMWRCGSCSTALQPNQMHAKFCFNCGRAVKWDD